MSNEVVIGIDLGTTNSCVAVLKDGVMEVIPNEFGDRTTPSIVAICKDGSRLIGKQAQSQQYRNLKNTIYESKRLIGKKYSEESIQDRMLLWPFKIVEGKANNPMICIHIISPTKTTKYFYPEEISGMVLEKMRTIAEAHFNCCITNAVITVPAYFNDNQRQATIDAAKIAKLNVLKIINEPTAAAFAYIYKNNINKSCNTLVFDLGGGTFDVSIINSNDNQFKVIAVNGDPNLGGADFDTLLYNEIVNIIQKVAGQRILFEKQQTRRIMANCVKVKEQLSQMTQSQFDLPNIVENLDFDYTFTRQKFEILISHLIKKIMSIVKTTLIDARMSVENVDNIVLVGGSSRIPAIIRNLQEYFKKPVSFAVNPDEAVACGAALQAAILNEDKSPRININILDVIPFSLGIEAESKYMDVIIKKNTTLPISFTKIYTTILDNQTAIRIIVYQGEDALTMNNTKLGYFDLTDIPAAPARCPIIKVTFDVNTNGVLEVTAIETSSNEIKKVRIVTNTGRISKADFTRIENENIEYFKLQLQKEKLIKEKNILLELCFERKRNFNQSADTDEKKKCFIDNVDKIINCLECININDETSLDEINNIRKVLYKM